MTGSNPVLATNINRSSIKEKGDTVMKNYDLNYVQKAMQGCVDNNYKMICRAARILEGLARGNSINCEDKMKTYYISSLYRKFLRSYTRYILNNPNAILDISRDCNFSAIAGGEYIGINEA